MRKKIYRENILKRKKTHIRKEKSSYFTDIRVLDKMTSKCTFHIQPFSDFLFRSERQKMRS